MRSFRRPAPPSTARSPLATAPVSASARPTWRRMARGAALTLACVPGASRADDGDALPPSDIADVAEMASLQLEARLAADQLANNDAGATTIISKLSELMFIEAVRRYIDGLPPQETGWLAGLRDPAVGRALALMHTKPAHNWSADDLARALVNEPKVLLLDEPLGALDLKLREQMQEELKSLQRKLGITFVYVTHSQSEAFAMADRIVIMSKGEIAQIGTAREIYRAPVNRFVAEFVGRNNIFTGISQGGGSVETPFGTLTVSGERAKGMSVSFLRRNFGITISCISSLLITM